MSGTAATEVRPRARSDASALRRRRATTWMTYSFLLALAVVFLFPFVIAIVTSFKTDPNAASRFKYGLKDRVRSRRGEGVVLQFEISESVS